ncbi:MAG TPA: lysylphosphatidylglycerol synthase transmembrane domain-containing protein [Gaiellaceae bacterium]|nr:lysylphosphatidylglycerol synthase transmembrane domain-containing protein [Gaiellaceae bacterium]
MSRSRRGRRLAGRTLFLLVSLVSLYVLLPSLLEVFTSWRELFDLAPAWVAVALAAETLAFLAIWRLQRIALQSPSRLPVALSQLGGNALGRIIPGGGAAAAALQFRMLLRAGFPGGRIASALTGVSVLLFGTMLALPLLSLPALLAGAPVERGLIQAAVLGAGVFVLTLAGGVTVFVWDRPLVVVGELAQTALNRTFRRGRHVSGLPDRLLGERDFLRTTFGKRWEAAVLASAGRWIFDYLALLACLRAVGAEPSPSLVLLAYVAGMFLSMIPLTPGGLGFVEAGLTGMLALAGVGAAPAAVATLAYRLISFWLPIPVGAVAYGLFQRRYPSPATSVD